MAKASGIDLDLYAASCLRQKDLEQITDPHGLAGSHIKNLSERKPVAGFKRQSIGQRHVIHVEKVPLIVEAAHAQHRRLQSGFNARNLAGKVWRNEGFGLPRTSVIEWAHDTRGQPGNSNLANENVRRRLTRRIGVEGFQQRILVGHIVLA